jgi:hypothetical protein
MALVVGFYDRLCEPHDENGIFVWAGAEGRAQYGASSAFKNRPRAFSQTVDDWDWFDTTEAAKALADRNGLQTVYVYRP